MRSLSVCLILSVILSITSPCLSLWRGPSPLIADPQFPEKSVNHRPINQTAYVAIHTHTNSHRDRYALEGILTMYGTLIDAINHSPIDASIDQSINHPLRRPRVVLVTANTPKTYRDEYTSHSLQVIEIPDQSKVQSAVSSIDRSMCAERFNKIHLWNADILPYDKVVFVDSDVLVIHPLDRLFDCANFCMVYSSIQHFTDSIFVVKPDSAMYSNILSSYLALPAIPHRSHCAEESWHFFLYRFGDIEAAPLFDPSVSAPANQSLARLSSSWSLNAMMYYEFFTWRLMRGKEFRNYNDTDGIPSFSLSFTGLKPFNFAPGIFFNLNWLWHKERDQQLHKSYTTFLIFWGLTAFVTALFGLFGVRPLIDFLTRRRKTNEGCANLLNGVRSCMITLFGYPALDTEDTKNPSVGQSVKPSYFSLFYFWLPLLGPTWTCLFIAFLMLNINGWLLYYTIDILTPPFMAWCVFCTMHGLMTIVDLQILRYAFHFSPQKWRKHSLNQSINQSSDESHSLLSGNTDRPIIGTSQSFNHSTQQISSPKLSLNLLDCVPMWAWEWITFLSMRSKIFPEFVVKMFAIFPAVAAVLIAHVNVWRHLINQAHQLIDTQGSKHAK